MTRLAVALVLVCCSRAGAADRSFPLESADGLRLHNVTAVPETLHGKKGVRVTASEAPETPRPASPQVAAYAA